MIDGPPPETPPEPEGGEGPRGMSWPPLGILILDPNNPPTLEEIEEKMNNGILTITTREAITRAVDKVHPLLKMTVEPGFELDTAGSSIKIQGTPTYAKMVLSPKIADAFRAGRHIVGLNHVEADIWGLVFSPPVSTPEEISSALPTQTEAIAEGFSELGSIPTKLGGREFEEYARVNKNWWIKIIGIYRDSAEAMDLKTGRIIRICKHCENGNCLACDGTVPPVGELSYRPVGTPAPGCGCHVRCHPRYPGSAEDQSEETE